MVPAERLNSESVSFRGSRAKPWRSLKNEYRVKGGVIEITPSWSIACLRMGGRPGILDKASLVEKDRQGEATKGER